jgi:hypothetical protein
MDAPEHETRREKAKLWIAVARGFHVPGERCYTHGESATWWRRGRDLVCQQCHPDPNSLEVGA